MLRGGVRRLENAAEGEVDSFRTKDGRRYVYNPQEVGIELFLYACASIRDPYTDDPPPEEPAFLDAVRDAATPEEVISRFQSGFVNLRAMVYAEEG